MRPFMQLKCLGLYYSCVKAKKTTSAASELSFKFFFLFYTEIDTEHIFIACLNQLRSKQMSFKLLTSERIVQIHFDFIFQLLSKSVFILIQGTRQTPYQNDQLCGNYGLNQIRVVKIKTLYILSILLYMASSVSSIYIGLIKMSLFSEFSHVSRVTKLFNLNSIEFTSFV